MAILENIRKRTTVLILIIGLALFAFVISGVIDGGTGSGGLKVGSSVAEINGEEISIDAFRQKVELASRNGGPRSSSLQTMKQVWDNELRNVILGQQFEDLGISIEQDQIINFLKLTPYAQSPEFQNENGVFDEYIFREAVLDWKVNDPARYNNWLLTEDVIIEQAKQQTYFNLVKAGVGATLKEGELDYKLANDKVDISYVRIPYTSIPDSSIVITKKEIENYIAEHEDEYTQEASRDIQFVYFEEKPSLTDETTVKAEITKLLDDNVEYNEQTDTTYSIAGFRTTRKVAEFLDINSDIKFDTIYKAKKNISPAILADTLMALNVNDLYGPYRDGNYFKVFRMMGKKSNGSVKASHILITYEGAERANPSITRTKEEAEKRANELLAEAKAEGAVFTELARENSDGPSAPRGGDLGYFEEGIMTEKFNDFAFGNVVGHVGLVETEFGFHIVRVDDKQDIVQIATLAREVEPSEETINELFTEATKFEMASIEGDQQFTDLAKESEFTVRPVNKIKELDENLPGLSAQRGIVQWAFNKDTEIGDIKRFNINNGYAVVQVTAAYKKGLMSSEEASSRVLPILRKKQKAAQIITANSGKNLADLASANNVNQSSASAITMKSPTIPGAGREPLVIGTAFAMNEGDTSKLVEGETGVFMLSVTKKEEAAQLDNYSTYANTLKTSTAAKVNTSVFNALKEASDIEDNRAVFY